MNDEPTFALVKTRRVVHAVFASGGPDDGSLWGFSTYCGLFVKDNQENPNWREVQHEPVTCKNCLRSTAYRATGKPLLEGAK